MHVTVEGAVAADFPGLTVASAVVDGLRVDAAAAKVAADVLAAAAADVTKTRTRDGLRDDPVFRAYRDFYWRLGIDPTKTRPSAEALNRRVLNRRDLPRINACVDAYNAASLATGIPLGAYDAGTLEAPVRLRFAVAGERFVGIGPSAERTLAGGEPVLADAQRVINFYPYRDAHATRVTEETSRVLLVACGVPDVARAIVQSAAQQAAETVARVCGGHVAGGGRA